MLVDKKDTFSSRALPPDNAKRTEESPNTYTEPYR